MKHNLIDRSNEKSLAHAVSKVVKNIPEEEYRKTFEKLLGRMELCINNRGDYFEHLIKNNSNFLFVFIVFFLNCRAFGQT